MYDNRGNDSINCSVSSCNYNNEQGKCILENIQIACTTNENYCNDTYETICNSFCPSVNQDYEMAREILEDLRD